VVIPFGLGQFFHVRERYMAHLVLRKRLPLWVTALDWSPDGASLVAGGRTRAGLAAPVVIWQAASGKTLRSYRALASPVMDLAWSPDSVRVAAACWDGTLQVWEGMSGQAVCAIPAQSDNRPATSVAWSPTGEYLAVGPCLTRLRHGYLASGASW
jgi:WD40 repeat protein